MTVVRWVSGLLALLFVVCGFVAGVANGLLLAATFFGAVCAWSCGMFTAEFWVGRMPDEFEFIESVEADINAL